MTRTMWTIGHQAPWPTPDLNWVWTGENKTRCCHRDHRPTGGGGARFQGEVGRVCAERRVRSGGYHAFCPVLKGRHTQGDSREEALANIRAAIAVYLESLTARGEPVPAE